MQPVAHQDASELDLPALGMRSAAGRLARYALSAHAEVRSGDGWFAVVTGAGSNDMNGVVSEPGAPLPDRLLDELLGWFEDSAVRRPG